MSTLPRIYCCFVCLLLIAVGRGTSLAAEKPNILFIFADDQCFETVGAFGHTEVKTPNLDRLVRQGTTFRRAYNMGGWHGAVCVASRTMLNTGRFLWHAKQLETQLDGMARENRLWSQRLERAGYETFFTGKWHVRVDPKKIFQHVNHVRGGMPKQTPEGYDRPSESKPDKWSPFDKKFGGFWEGGKHWSEVLADDAVRYLGESAENEQPFFMYLAFNAPHDPRQSPREYVEQYPLESIRLPRNFLAEYPYKDAIGCGKRLRDERLAPFPRTPHSVDVNRQEYYAIITHMDAQIGRILAKLEQTGQRENTWIFFTADHGLSVGHHGLLGKQNMYDHSVRVPFVVVGPEVPGQTTVDAPIYLQDIMPTTLELAGVDKPEDVEFQSLLRLVRGEETSHYDAIYGAYIDLQRMVTVDEFKLILYPKISKARLFNLREDPLEMNDLSDDPDYADKLSELFATLLKLQDHTGDQLQLEKQFGQLAAE